MPATSYQHYAGGQWRDAEGKVQFDVLQPYDRAVFARVAAGGRKEAKGAIEGATALLELRSARSGLGNPRAS
jgi:acyl-CoA reductase-like NAD-dependent aldehyde dehydrogenase